MGKIESLDEIKRIWDSHKSFEDTVLGISEIYYSNGLNLESVAAYIRATPAELDAALKLSELDEELIKKISVSNPPKTAWTILASASEDEIKRMYEEDEKPDYDDTIKFCRKLIGTATPTAADKVGALSSIVIDAMRKKGLAYSAITPNSFPDKFLRSISRTRKFGKLLTDKQIKKLIEILTSLVNSNVITRDCIDDDAEYCNIVLDALGK